MPDQEVPRATIRLRPGHRLICYTDGITEAMNGQQELFGEDRLADIWRVRGEYRSRRHGAKGVCATRPILAGGAAKRRSGAASHGDYGMIEERGS